jgi:hypothetical protein
VFLFLPQDSFNENFVDKEREKSREMCKPNLSSGQVETPSNNFLIEDHQVTSPPSEISMSHRSIDVSPRNNFLLVFFTVISLFYWSEQALFPLFCSLHLFGFCNSLKNYHDIYM